MKITVDVPDPKQPDLERALDRSFARIDKRLRSLETPNKDLLKTQVDLQRTLREVANQPKDLVKVFGRALTKLSMNSNTKAEDVTKLRSDLTKSLTRLETVLNKQYKRKLESKTTIIKKTEVPDKITVRMPPSLSLKMNRLEEAILNSRPKTYAVTM